MTQEPEVTTISEKGQVVIPQEIRENLKIKPKTKFLVFGKGDTIIMKKLDLDDAKREWEQLLKIMDKKSLKMTNKEILEEVQSYRNEKRKV